MPSPQRVALITGATGLLGNSVASAFHEAGIRLALPLHDIASTDRLPPALRNDAPTVLIGGADLADPLAVASFVDKTTQTFGSIEYLLNLAGGYVGGAPTEEVSVEEWDRMMSLNLRSAFLMIKSVLPVMKRAGFGRIVNIAAMPPLRSGALRSAYAVSKGGIITLTQSVADEVRGTAITVNAIAPSSILARPETGTTGEKGVHASSIAAVAGFLCSADASAVNGSILKMFGAS
jgi:NAD(P)-dependent dehydrogenase (short-subunit alcohol dehydrogenase family)